MNRERLQQLFDWLVDGAVGSDSPAKILAEFANRLSAAGVPLERVNAFVRTLHPRVAGRRFAWRPGVEVAEVGELPWGDVRTAEFIAGPLYPVFESGAEIRERLGGTAALRFAGALSGLRADGFTDYLALPLKFIGGTNNGITFATKQPGGFTDEQLEALRYATRPLARVAETLALMRTAVNLLNTYVGRDAGERILGGRIQPGDTEIVRCAIWFSDLRGFTSLSGEQTPQQTIATLNELFDCQVPRIEQNGGEVLKFIGDGLLAIFPISAERDEHAAAEAAASASQQAFTDLAKLNAAHIARGTRPIRFGLSLHVGDVAYGNIGGSNRLDFTAIGSAVNLASRIEGLTGKLGKDVLLSEPFAHAVRRPTRQLGTFELKGFASPQPVYELGG